MSVSLIGPDQSSCGWSLQVELVVEVVEEVVVEVVEVEMVEEEESRGQLTLCLPGLHTQQTFPVRFLPGRTRNTYTLQVNTVRPSVL